MNFWICVTIIGVGATFVMDLWGVARVRLLGAPAPDYGLVGRWIGHMMHGRLCHGSITQSPRVAGEQPLGWIVHYLVGIAFASLLVGIWGIDWVRDPTPGPALLVGIGTVAAPFLIMQPAMGIGVAASRALRPWRSRMQSLVNHLVFGLGLYVAGWGAGYLLDPTPFRG